MKSFVLHFLFIAFRVQPSHSFQPVKEAISGFEPNAATTTVSSEMSTVGSGTDNDALAGCNGGNKDVITFSSAFRSGTSGEEQQNTATRTALVILNYKIPGKSLLLEHLWKTSHTRIAADGGANRLYEYSKDLIPDRIRGDLDSLDPKVRAYYESQNVSVEQDFCQNTNDLDKALQVLLEDQNNAGGDDKVPLSSSSSSSSSSLPSIDRVVIYGAFGGRFDQEMASFVALYKWAHRFNGQMYLYSDETCAFLIPANKACEIFLPFYGTPDDPNGDGSAAASEHEHQHQHELGEGPTCGLIPLGCPCESIVTTGLQWDLDGSIPLAFGGLVSTSNRIVRPTVTISASHPVVFTAELVSKTAMR